MTKIAILTFDGFNEIDSFLALNILNRLSVEGLKAEITSPTPTVTSMNGVPVYAQRQLEFASEADVVLVGSGKESEEISNDMSVISRLSFDPDRQLICSQCSGAFILARMGLLEGINVCTDNSTRKTLIESGFNVIDSAFAWKDNVATAGGCLSAPYLAGWIILRLLGKSELEKALSYVAPAGEEAHYMAHVLQVVEQGYREPMVRV